MQTNTRTSELIKGFRDLHLLDEQFETSALNWFIPLAEQLALHQSSAKAPFFVGLNGCQGSGKSTLTSFIQSYLQQIKGLEVVNLSLDDFYLSHSQRLALAIKVHPLLATRGVPGTHNTRLMKKIFNALAEGQTEFKIPKFNKATDNPEPMSTWPVVQKKVDIILFEGWCWGVMPQSELELQLTINPLEQQSDPIGVWRNYVNQQITQSYVSLYAHMQYWIMLQAPSFKCVYEWRLQQEEKLTKRLALQQTGDPAATQGVMEPQQIQTFIQHYQRLTEHSLKTLPDTVDVVFSLNSTRNITSTSGLI